MSAPSRPATPAQVGLVAVGFGAELAVVVVVAVVVEPLLAAAALAVAALAGLPLTARSSARELRLMAGAFGGLLALAGAALFLVGGYILLPGALLLLAAAATPTVGWRERRSVRSAVGSIGAAIFVLAAIYLAGALLGLEG